MSHAETIPIRRDWGEFQSYWDAFTNGTPWAQYEGELHELKHVTYRISRVTDQGPFVGFTLEHVSSRDATPDEVRELKSLLREK